MLATGRKWNFLNIDRRFKYVSDLRCHWRSGVVDIKTTVTFETSSKHCYGNSDLDDDHYHHGDQQYLNKHWEIIEWLERAPDSHGYFKDFLQHATID